MKALQEACKKVIQEISFLKKFNKEKYNEYETLLDDIEQKCQKVLNMD